MTAIKERRSPGLIGVNKCFIIERGFAIRGYMIQAGTGGVQG